MSETPSRRSKRLSMTTCRLNSTPSKRARIEPRKPSLSAASITIMANHADESRHYAICQSVETLFGAEILSLPCVSARLVACFSLATVMPPQGPLWQLCQALVQVEAISLRSDEMTANNTPSTTEPRKKISFCSFDFSSSLPPVDRVEGSEERQHELIQALVLVKRAILNLEANAATEKTALQKLVNILGEQENYLKWQQDCAKSIRDDYPLRRVQSAWERYHVEFAMLLNRMTATPTTVMFASITVLPVLQVERRLAHFVGQAIRYELRSLLNPPPPRGCSQDVTYDNRAALFSQAYMSIEFKGTANGDAIRDNNLATLVSRALRCMYDYFGLDVLMQAEPNAMLTILPSKFCASTASAKTIPSPTYATKDSRMETHELDDVLYDIDQSESFLRVVGASHFLNDLLGISKVRSEIERRGGWSQLETYASISWQYQLFESIDEDAHLVALANVNAFVDKIKAVHSVIIDREEDCRQSLDGLFKRKRLTTRSATLLEQYPAIPLMLDRVKQCRLESNVFPRVHPVK